MKEIQAPNKFEDILSDHHIFLAGSIEMGKAEEWQKEVVNALKDENVVFLNPRRDDWDSSWEQKIGNRKFYEQVTWELDALEYADTVFIYFAPGTQSPISLLELGLFHDGAVVFCPEGFWRKGNVDIVCEHYNIKQVHSWKEAYVILKNRISSWD